jgi:hypothetical protein
VSFSIKDWSYPQKHVLSSVEGRVSRRIDTKSEKTGFPPARE